MAKLDNLRREVARMMGVTNGTETPDELLDALIEAAKEAGREEERATHPFNAISPTLHTDWGIAFIRSGANPNPVRVE